MIRKNIFVTLIIATFSSLIVGAHVLSPDENWGVPADVRRITFYKDVLPILQRNCQTCHRPGEIGPMSLMDYKDAKPYAKAIKKKVEQRLMPPWYADPHFGKFSNDRSLPEADLNTLVAWVDAGAVAGNPKDAPPPVKWPTGWRIGKPDVVYEMPVAFQVPASGTIDYHYAVIPLGFKEDRWVALTEMRPGDRSVVHHANAFLRPPGSKWMADAKPGSLFLPTAEEAKSGIPGSNEYELLASYTPGLQPWQCRPGAAKLVKAGSDIILEIHYVTNGTPTTDRTQIGLIFYRGQPKMRELTMKTANASFVIPAGNPDYEVKSQIILEGDSQLVGMMPHMHFRGKDFSYKIVFPNGQSTEPLFVPHYDFRWQNYYALQEPIALPKGTMIQCIAHFDNSANNKQNPDPTKNVRWGQQTWEEMMLGWFDVTIPANTDPKDLYSSVDGGTFWQRLWQRFGG